MPAAPASPEAESSAQLAALLGVSEGPGHVALVGALAAHADALADRIPGVEVVAVDAGMRAATEREGVSRLVAGSDLPFQPWTFRALAADGTRARPEEWARLVGRGGRIVISRPEEDAAERLERAGTRLLLRQPDWIVALVETS